MERKERALSSDTPLPPEGLRWFNSAAEEAAIAALLACCASRGWARRVAAHRPYPDAAALLAAAAEASYDLAPGGVAEALAAEADTLPQAVAAGPGGFAATALRAAHQAYRARFGHPFVLALEGVPPEEALGETLAALHRRLAADPEEESATAAEELRRLALARLRALTQAQPAPSAPVLSV